MQGPREPKQARKLRPFEAKLSNPSRLDKNFFFLLLLLFSLSVKNSGDKDLSRHQLQRPKVQDFRLPYPSGGQSLLLWTPEMIINALKKLALGCFVIGYSSLISRSSSVVGEQGADGLSMVYTSYGLGKDVGDIEDFELGARLSMIVLRHRVGNNDLVNS